MDELFSSKFSPQHLAVGELKVGVTGGFNSSSFRGAVGTKT